MTALAHPRRARALAAMLVAGALLLAAEPPATHAQTGPPASQTGPPASQTGPAVARVAAIEGTASVERLASRERSALALESPLYRADTVHTAAGSKVRLVFDGDTAVTLGELASLRITQIAEAARGGTEASRLTVLAGTVRFRVRPGPPPALMETWTPTAVAAVRGTEYIVEVTAQGTAILVIDGAVAVSSYRPDVRGTVVLQAGEGTSVAPDRPPGPATRWGDARRRAVEEATRLP